MKILIALGGNAILQHKEKGTAEEQFSNVRRACVHLAEIIKDGHQIVITHGNGPQVGDILLKDELARLADVMRVRPLVFACWRYRHAIVSGKQPDGTEWWWPSDELVESITARARAAFERPLEKT